MHIDINNKTVHIDDSVELGYIISKLNEVGVNNHSIFRIIPKALNLDSEVNNKVDNELNIIDNNKQLRLFND
jgi:hypothetical protein